MRPLFITFLFLFISLFSYAQDDVYESILEQKNILSYEPENKQALKELSFLLLHQSNYDEAIRYGRQLLDIGLETNDSVFSVLYGYIALGQGHLMKGNDSLAYSNLNLAKDIATTNQKDSALCSVFNGLGLYASNIEKDYYRAINYFSQGLESANRSNYEELQTILLTNISGIYFLKDDPGGLLYALEAYEIGHQLGNPYLIFAASANAGSMYLLLKDYEKALQYMKEAEFLMKRNNFHNQSHVYALYGYILLGQEYIDEAIDFFQKGLDMRETAQTTSVVNTLLGYAKAHLIRKNPDVAIRMLKEALEITYLQNNATHRDKLLKELSFSYEEKGQYDRALEWQRVFQIESDSLFNSDKERAISDLRVKYDLEHQKNIAKEAQLNLLQKSKNEQLLISLLIVILLVVIFLIYFIWKRNKIFATIIHQYRARIRLENQMQKKIENLGSKDEPKNKYSVSSLTEERSIDLFTQLEKLMSEEKIYHDNFLTREKVAELLGSNRTYLSQIINQHTSLTFTQYLNEYRINEVLKLMNDSKDQLPLKTISSNVGFSSTTTFYKAFQNIVGMTPSQYKSRSKEIYRSE